MFSFSFDGAEAIQTGKVFIFLFLGLDILVELWYCALWPRHSASFAEFNRCFCNLFTLCMNLFLLIKLVN